MEIKKAVLKGTNKNKIRCTFTFEKSWEVVNAIDGILGKIVLPSSFNCGLKDMMCGEDFSSDDDINNWGDNIYFMKEREYSIDIFVGEKIIILINSRKDRQAYISEVVFEFADFKVDKEVSL